MNGIPGRSEGWLERQRGCVKHRAQHQRSRHRGHITKFSCSESISFLAYSDEGSPTKVLRLRKIRHGPFRSRGSCFPFSRPASSSTRPVAPVPTTSSRGPRFWRDKVVPTTFIRPRHPTRLLRPGPSDAASPTKIPRTEWDSGQVIPNISAFWTQFNALVAAMR